MSENSFSQLPKEILGEILSRAAGCIELPIHHCNRAFSEPRNPWDLALVCRDWRNAVFSTPCIWSDFVLTVIPNKQNSHKYSALLPTLKLCLDRSRGRPLTIEFIAASKTGESDQILVFLKLLMEHAQRWESVAIRATLDTLLPHLSKCPIRYTRLRRLHIDSCFSQPKEDWVGLFHDAPLLSHISLNNLPYHGQRLGGVGIPWSQISHLKIYVLSGALHDLIDILKTTLNLVTLDYSVSYSHFGQGELSILELSHLQRLAWTNRNEASDGPVTSGFFRLLKAPQLSVLKVNAMCGNQEYEAIRGCLQRSGCSITSLNLSSPHLSPLLSLTPDVETLVFTNTSSIYGHDDIKSNDVGDGHLELAHLRKIEVVYGSNVGVDRHLATSKFFDLLKAPRLSVLEIDGVCHDKEMIAICRCLERSMCSIKSLKLAASHLSPLLSLTSDVETLVLPRPAEEHLISLFRELTFDRSTDLWLFPKLKKIMVDFDIADEPPAPFDMFVGMLKSRLWAPPDSLVHLRCNKLRELELGFSVSRDMRLWVEEILSQECLVITYKKSRQLYDRWDF